MINATVTGHLGQNLEQRFTGSGKAVVNLSICATPQRKDPQTGQYADFGLPIWVEAPIWGYEAEALLDAGVGKGWKVTVTGVLAHETYQARDGQTKQKTTLFNTRLLGVMPPKQQQQGGTPGQPPQQPAPAQGYSQQPQQQAQPPAQQPPQQLQQPALQAAWPQVAQPPF
ncbi:single-stranded DNA-binding protein [Winkia sp. UMB0889B]|uniref:single-stranded DNA-binding protein n=1 Tax=Winkia sp. UMB0889B TaxID=3046315 RepID=UPI00255440F2|nr:single-stranded DNA-binding protein [Winkia sp. UMB0889B]MDK7904852.1 single-stranded DNA-binding protein [Winkia sp. UMB0889B]